MRYRNASAFTAKILAATSALLLSALPLGAQCQMQFNLSLYNDTSVSADFSTVYDTFNGVDNSTPCSCSHSNYQATAQIYSPSGAHSSTVESGLESYGSLSTNGELGNYSAVGLQALNCSCYGPVQTGSGGSQPVTGAAGCSISFGPTQFTAKCNGSQNSSIFNLTFSPTTASSCFASSATCSASPTSGSNVDMGSPACSALSLGTEVDGHVLYFTGGNPPPPSHTNEGSIQITNNFTLNSQQVSAPNTVSVVCQ